MLYWLLPAALALQVPTFSPSKRVHITPPDAQPAVQVSAAAAETQHRVFVLVFAEVIDGHIAQPWTSETEEALEAVWAAWAQDSAFDAREDVVIVLGLDDREVRVRAGSRWDDELGLHTEALGELIDEHFLPLARTTDLDGALASLTAGVDAEIDQRIAWRVWRARLPWMPLPLIALGAAGWWTRQRRKARTAFEEEARVWADKLDRAEETLASFTMDVELRNRLIELRRDGPETDDACRRLAERIEEIRAGLAGMRRRQDEARSAGRARGWDTATEMLSAPFEIDTGEHRLFDDPARQLRIEPEAFIADLEAQYQEARALWARLEEAVRLSLQPIKDIISADRLTSVIAALKAMELGEAWLSPHPLFPDPEAGLATLAEMRQDPYHFIGVWETFQEAEADYLEDVEALIDLLKAYRSRQAKKRDLPQLNEPEAARLPALWERSAQLNSEIEQMTHTAVSVEAFSKATQEAIAVEDQLTRLQGHIAASIEKATEGLALAETHLHDVREKYTTAQQELTARSPWLGEADSAELVREMTEAHEDITQMTAAFAEARRQLANNQPLSCLRTLQKAQQEHKEALGDLSEFGAALDAVQEARDATEALASMLDATRAKHKADLDNADLPETYLSAGDELRSQLREDLGWRERHKSLRVVLRAWKDGVKRAHNAKARAYETRQFHSPTEAKGSVEDQLRAMRRKELVSFFTFGISDFVQDVSESMTAPANSGQFTDHADRPTTNTRPKRHSSRSSSLGSGFSNLHSPSSMHSPSSRKRSSSASAGRSFGNSSGRSGGRSIGGGGGRSGGRKF